MSPQAIEAMLSEAIAEARSLRPSLNIARLQLHPAQQQVMREASRYNILDCGRRWGKTILGTDLEIEIIAQGYPVGWFAPTYKILLDAWGQIADTLRPYATKINNSDRLIKLAGGGQIDGWTLEDENAGRGRKYKRVIIDEAAQAKNLQKAWEMSIRPTLTDYRGDAWFLGTPRGRNYFWQLYQLGQDATRPEYKSWHMPTASNPYIAPEEIEEARLMLPEAVFEQEYLAAFLENEGSVFRNLLACLNAPLETTPKQHQYHTLVAGVDWAKQQDYTCISIGCIDCMQEVARDRMSQIDYHLQWQLLDNRMREWHVNTALVEQNSIGEPGLEALTRAGLPVIGFETTAISKPPLIENLALSFERTEWQFQADPIWTGELEAYERKVSPITGRSSYSAPEGQHDDTVIARALMVWAAHNSYEDAGAMATDNYSLGHT